MDRAKKLTRFLNPGWWPEQLDWTSDSEVQTLKLPEDFELQDFTNFINWKNLIDPIEESNKE